MTAEPSMAWVFGAGSVPVICRVCGESYEAGHICLGPEGSPLERGLKKLRLRLRLSSPEADAVLAHCSTVTPAEDGAPRPLLLEKAQSDANP